jgi:DNA-binding NarL/FixJ family response regulator
MHTDSTDPTTNPADTSVRAPRPLHAQLIDVEPATTELIELWLGAEGWLLRSDAEPGDAVDIIVVELAFPRHADRQRIRTLSEVWPDAPVIVLSPTFFADVPAHGDVARQLGVAAVLATPLSRDGLRSTVARLLAS